jgi:hypothetical protein
VPIRARFGRDEILEMVPSSMWVKMRPTAQIDQREVVGQNHPLTSSLTLSLARAAALQGRECGFEPSPHLFAVAPTTSPGRAKLTTCKQAGTEATGECVHRKNGLHSEWFVRFYSRQTQEEQKGRSRQQMVDSRNRAEQTFKV